MKKMMIWLWLLTKRLYKKPAFLALLVLIPVLIFCYKGAMQGQSGVMTIALAQEGNDPLATKMIEDLSQADQLFAYRLCGSQEEAQLLVETGKVDAAWIFPENMEQKIEAFLESPNEDHACVVVLRREENIAHRLAQERLSGQIYDQLSRQLYLRYMRENFPVEYMTDEQLLEGYDSIQPENGLFAYETLGGEPAADTHYLLTPVRGVLGVVGVLCALAAAMYYEKDKLNGTFGWLSLRRRPFCELASQAVANGNVMLVGAVALLLTGLDAGLGREVVLWILYSLCLCAFGMLVRALCRKISVIGVLMPLLAVVMLLVCPVFLDLAKLRLWQLLLPPTYYILGAYNSMYLLYMVLYSAVCFGVYSLLPKK